MISRMAVFLLLAVSFIAIVSAQSPQKNLTGEEEKKKQAELRKKIKETLEGAVSDVALLKRPENKIFYQVRIACLLWPYDEKGARSLIEDAQGLTASMINDPKINNNQGNFLTMGWGMSGIHYIEEGGLDDRNNLRGHLVSMIAQRDPQVALEFLQKTKYVIPQDGMQSARARSALSIEARVEQELALQIAKKDPKRALEMAEASLKTGISFQLNELIRIVFEKDKESGKKLAGAVLSKLKSTDITGNPDSISVALTLLEGEYDSRRTVSAIGENSSGNIKRQPVLDDQALREWNNFVIQAALTQIGQDLPNYREGREFIRNHLLNLMGLLPEIEKLSPALIANFKQRYGQLAPNFPPRSKMHLETANAKAEDILALAIKSQGELRKEYLYRAVDTALDSERNFELSRKIAEEHFTDPDDRKNMMERIEERELQYSVEHGKIEDVAASLISLESDAERARRVADLAGRALRSGDKKLAAELLEKALGFLLQPVETRDEYEAMIRIIHNSIGIDHERSFEMFGALIDPINQIVTATLQFKRYDGKRSDLIRDEIPFHEIRGNFPARGFVDVIISLSKADFDRAIAQADRIRQPELKLQMKLLAIQAVTTESVPKREQNR
ncbi:MAG: hypothetical protein L0220_19660 [Acidobacteria bacterium]|nr:hypothetical protein [Acidobacteriota bacterium]